MCKIKPDRIKEIIDAFNGKKILIIGDIMIDEYLSGKVNRISPEAPVPIIDIKEEVIRFGGAANVALNVKALGGEPIIIGLVGNDKMGDAFKELMLKHNLRTDGLISGSRPTTVKTRIIGDNQHIARVDKEVKTYASAWEEKKILDKLNSLIGETEALILEDYNKGTLSVQVIEKAISIANERNIYITVDPKFTNFLNYKNVTVFKPNIKEAQNALAREFNGEADIEGAGFELLKKMEAKCVLLTRGSKGLSIFEDSKVFHIPTLAKNVADVSGAGDTVISTCTMAMTGGASVLEAAILANIAAGIVVEEVGIVPIEKESLLKIVW